MLKRFHSLAVIYELQSIIFSTIEQYVAFPYEKLKDSYESNVYVPLILIRWEFAFGFCDVWQRRIMLPDQFIVHIVVSIQLYKWIIIVENISHTILISMLLID